MLPLRSVGRSNGLMVCADKNFFNNVDSKATHFNKNNYIMKSTVDNYGKNTINNMSRTKVHTKGRRRVNLRTGKLKRIKTQVMSRHPWHSGPRVAETWVRLPASAGFFICSVASFLLCCHCEVLEGPTE